ncbi:MAG TPA: LPS export ABC transporter periplasmic protein LptC [Burkholderiales bacterium]|nr:LPS export ABC transporter periplasmic protein LptC [Burkholderiales bacterium]
MRLRSNTLFTLGLAAGLAALTFWLERLVDSQSASVSRPRARVPEFVVERITAMSMDKSGRAESRLTAQRMLYYPDEETTEVEEPRLTQFPASGPPIRVSAERGTVDKDGNDVRLFGNVVVIRESVGDRPELRVDTTYLQVFPKTEVARTPEPVLITEGSSKLSGVGMEFDNAKRQLELKARVSGTFEPSASKAISKGVSVSSEQPRPKKK